MNLHDKIKSHYEECEYPSLAFLREEWAEHLPFAGMVFFVATPIYRNTLVQYEAFLAGGAEIILGREFVSCDKTILQELLEIGFKCYSLQEALTAEKEGFVFDIVFDCAGQFASLNPRYGFVELTRSGMQFYETLKQSVFVADSGIIKRIETTLGTGDGYFRALAHLGLFTQNAKKLLVFGSGKVGSGIALQGKKRGFSVEVVTDTQRELKDEHAFDAKNVLLANGIELTDFRLELQVAEKICNADFIVTATGKKNALDTPILTKALLETKAVIANMGVEDEFGESVPKSRVLNDKNSLNFMLEEPTHLKYIETSLALHAALGETLIQNALKGIFLEGLQMPPKDLEQKLLSITLQNGIIGAEIAEILGIPE